MKPRLRADWVVSIEVEELWIYESCRLSPIRRNSVVEELRDKRLEVIQEVICVRAFWRCEMFAWKSKGCFCLSDWSHGLDRLLDLLAHRFLHYRSIFLCFSYSYVRQTKLASSLVNFWAHNKIVFDLTWFDDFRLRWWRCLFGLPSG